MRRYEFFARYAIISMDYFPYATDCANDMIKIYAKKK